MYTTYKLIHMYVRTYVSFGFGILLQYTFTLNVRTYVVNYSDSNTHLYCPVLST